MNNIADKLSDRITKNWSNPKHDHEKAFKKSMTLRGFIKNMIIIFVTQVVIFSLLFILVLKIDLPILYILIIIISLINSIPLSFMMILFYKFGSAISTMAKENQ